VKVSEETHEIESEYIVAADGVNSKVRTALGIKPAQSFFTASERIKGIQANICEFWFGASHAHRSYSWVFPTSDGISIGTGSFEKGKVNDLLEVFRKRIGILPKGEKRFYRIPIWKGDLYNKDKVIFVGDAAGQVLPLTYEGIYYSMKAGEYASEAIIKGEKDLYKKLWKSRFQKRFQLMEKLGNYFLKDDDSTEKLVAIHRRPDIQEASLRLWISKDRSKEGLLYYIKLFRKFLH
jgi:geranylgeranyl reductase